MSYVLSVAEWTPSIRHVIKLLTPIGWNFTADSSRYLLWNTIIIIILQTYHWLAGHSGLGVIITISLCHYVSLQLCISESIRYVWTTLSILTGNLAFGRVSGTCIATNHKCENNSKRMENITIDQVWSNTVQVWSDLEKVWSNTYKTDVIRQKLKITRFTWRVVIHKEVNNISYYTIWL